MGKRNLLQTLQQLWRGCQARADSVSSGNHSTMGSSVNKWTDRWKNWRMEALNCVNHDEHTPKPGEPFAIIGDGVDPSFSSRVSGNGYRRHTSAVVPDTAYFASSDTI